MIKKVTFNSQVNNLEAGFSIEFNKPLTLLVGDNGAGKSTFLHNLYAWQLNKNNQSKPLWLNLKHEGNITVECDENDELFLIDGNGQNYQNRGIFDDDMSLQISQMRCSNGQAVMMAINNALTKNKNKNILVADELEVGLSLTNVLFYSQFINVISTRKQIIMAVHSQAFLELQEIFPERVDLYDFNTHEFTNSKDYQKSCRKEAFARMSKAMGLNI